MGYWQTPLARTCLLEGNRFWFYSLVFSIAWGFLQLLDAGPESRMPPVAKDGEKVIAESSSDEEIKTKLEVEEKRKRKMDAIKRKLVIDGFDLLSPGFVTGWINTSASVVGFSSVVSTVLSSKEIWDRLKG